MCLQRKAAAAARTLPLLLLPVLLLLVVAPAGAELPPAPPKCTPEIRRSIQWGVGSGSLAVEGALKAGGRAPSIWDEYGSSRPDVAIDFYNRFPQDIELMKQLGIRHFRMSISWPRLLPGGRKGSQPNPEAVAFYSSVLGNLTAAGIEPMLVLYHWDLPASLNTGQAPGFLGPSIVDDFAHYADTAFGLFGKRFRIKRWLTFIEPYVVCNMAFGSGQHAPGIDRGDEGRYKCGYHLLLAHAAAAQLYRQKHAASQGGQLSFSTLVTWPEPATASAADRRAAQNKLDAEVGWFLDPIFAGDWPASLKATKGAFLPSFTPAQQAMLRGSLDFIAANCFTARWVSARADGSPLGWRESRDGPDGRPIGAATGVPWIAAVPWSQARFLRYLSERYRAPGGAAPELVVSSSGVQEPGEESLAPPAALDDTARVDYYRTYLDSVCEAAAGGGVRLVSWYAWSLFDGYEFTDGHQRKFGIVHVSSPGAAGSALTRTPKASARWLSKYFFNAGGG